MEPIPNETWRSFQRSRYRRELLLTMSSLGEAYLGQLARMLGIRPSRVLALLYGRPPNYRVDLGIIPLGLVREKATVRGGRAWEITSRGRRKARSMTSGRVRGRARAGARRGPDPPAAAPVATAMARVDRTASFEWSFETEA